MTLLPVEEMLSRCSSRHASKRQILVLFAVLLSSISASALDRDRARQDLIEIEHRIGEANLNCDYKYFAFIEAPEYRFIAPDGSIATRATT